MSTTTVNIETYTEDRSIVALVGTLPSEFAEMKNDLSSRHHPLFGDISKVVDKINRDYGGKLSKAKIVDLAINGKNPKYYDAVWSYLCVRQSDMANYQFPIDEPENSEKQYARLRGGVVNFFDDGFDIYIIPSN